MRTNPLIVDTVRSLYLSGMDHRRIEREIHGLGCLTFTRRSLYNQKTKTGYRKGWIEKYGWKKELDQFQLQDRAATSTPRAETRVLTSVSYHPRPDAKPVEIHLSDEPQPPTDFYSWLKQIAPTMKWHWPYQKLIYQQLERVTSGESRRLMIFLPPRHGKSELVTNRYAAWRLKQNPKMNIILGSYNQRLANRFSRKVRITFEDALAREEGEKGRKGEEETADSKSHPNADSTRRSQEGGLDPADSTVSSTSGTGADPSSRSPHLPVSSSPLLSRSHRLNTVSEWETGLGGGVRAVGVGGGITGFGADLVIIDDPIKSRAEAESKTYRERVWDWFNDDLYTRLEPNGAIILIQTRWHEDDLAGRLLREASEEGGEHWDVISLPALAEGEPIENGKLRSENEKQKKVSVDPIAQAETRPLGSVFYHPQNNGELRIENEEHPVSNTNSTRRSQEGGFTPADQIEKGELKIEHEKPSGIPHSQLSTINCPLGRAPGEALCPERFNETDLLRIKRKLGSYSFSALYQQRPTPPEGGLFKRSWFTRIVNRPPENLRWARGYDLAVSTKDSADFTASIRCALHKPTGDLYIADGFRKKIEFPEQKRFIIERIHNEKNTEHGIEQALHGMAFIQELRREHRLFGRAFRGIKIKGDKFTRALSWANLVEEGKVVLVRGPWIDAFLEEICTFPNSTHDDQLDAVSIAVEMLERRKHVAFGF